MTVIKRPRLSDIAQRAGVSQATVSLVLNGVGNARIASATRDKVRKIADELGYSRRASIHRSGAPVIGMLLDEVITTPFAAPFIEGARLQAAEKGAVLMLCCTGGDPLAEAAAIETFRALPLAGVIYATLVTRAATLPDGLERVPTVLLNCHRAQGNLPSVVPADAEGAFAATMALIAAGHSRIAHIAGEGWGEAARHREAGWRQAMAAAGLPVAPDLLAGPAWTAVSGRDAALRLLGVPDRPTAIFCFNDRVALGVYEAAAECGLRVPEDLSVIGFDNDDIAATLQPPLTTMVLPHDDMARWAVDRLMSGLPLLPDHLRQECEMVRRGSVARARI